MTMFEICQFENISQKHVLFPDSVKPHLLRKILLYYEKL